MHYGTRKWHNAVQSCDSLLGDSLYKRTGGSTLTVSCIFFVTKAQGFQVKHAYVFQISAVEIYARIGEVKEIIVGMSKYCTEIM